MGRPPPLPHSAVDGVGEGEDPHPVLHPVGDRGQEDGSVDRMVETGEMRHPRRHPVPAVDALVTTRTDLTLGAIP